MTALDVIRLVYAHEGKLSIEGEILRVSAPAPLPDDLRQALREHKVGIMIALGAPLDIVIYGVLAEMRPHLPGPLRDLPEDKVLVLVNWAIMDAWQKALGALEGAPPCGGGAAPRQRDWARP